MTSFSSLEAALAQRLTLTICGLVLLAFASRRQWLSAAETGWIGGAMIFAASAWLLQSLLQITLNQFTRGRAILIALGLLTPVAASLVISLVILVRNRKRSKQTV